MDRQLRNNGHTSETHREDAHKYRALFDLNPDMVFEMNLLGELIRTNERCFAVTGYSAEQLSAMPLRQIVTEEDWKISVSHFKLAAQGKSQKFEVYVNHNHGHQLLFSVVAIPIEVEGRIVGIFGIATDITDRKLKEERFNHIVYYDELTGLPNRRYFNEILTFKLDQAADTNEKLAVMTLDIDRFKNVNDSLGHAFGDRLLRQVSIRLKSLCDESTIIARMGGDEFNILFAHNEGFENVIRFGQDIIDNIKEPMQIGGFDCHITASIGIAVSPMDGDDSDTLLKNADVAMFKAKEHRDNFQFYSPQLSLATLEELMLENDLRKAIDRGEFELHYQPKVNIRTQKLIGMEALIRWNHPDKGIIPPSLFIPIAEETGLIVPIGEWVLREACKQNKKWQDEGLPKLRIAVNLSSRQFYRNQLVSIIQSVLDQSGLEPCYLEIEITESMMLDLENTKSKLLELKQLGIHISLDDFGTGYSSLSYLKMIPIDRLKIDRSFVRDIAVDSGDAAIVATITSVARHLNLEVIAEGVETKDQIEFLLAQHCFEAQGYYYSPPLPGQQFAEKFLIPAS